MGRFLQFDHVSFAYPGMTETLVRDVSALFPEWTWTGIVGANGAGKTTLLKLAAGELAPSEGHVRTIGTAQYAVQRTDAPPAEWDEFVNAWDPVAMDVRQRLRVSDEWADRWETLSHGERKRVQIAIALWHRPDVLALDEPTNHLNATGKRILLEALKGFRGAGLVVSHDRDFLDALCSQCLFVFPPTAVMRPGGVTAGVLDVFMEAGLVFDGAVGVSAGACFGCNYKSRQPGRVIRYNTRFARDPRYCSWRSFLKTGDLFGADFCYRELPLELDLFDCTAYEANPMEFHLSVTDCETGGAVYRRLDHADEAAFRWMRASASMPLVSRPVEIGGRFYLDGGLLDGIPLAYLED